LSFQKVVAQRVVDTMALPLRLLALLVVQVVVQREPQGQERLEEKVFIRRLDTD
jgi:hypothetical protein